MTLTLSIRHLDRLDNGMPASFVLNRRGAVIGRAATCDWSLPDPRNYISSRHCEIGYRDGFYTLTDISTNGTFLNGAGERMAGPRRIERGDLFLIGQYEVQAELTGEAAAAVERHGEQAAAAAQQGEWSGWDSHAGAPAPAPPRPERGGWDDIPAHGGLSSGFGGAAAPLGPAPAGDGWGPAPATGGGWASPPAAPASPGWAPPATGPNLNREQPYARRAAMPEPSRPAPDALGGGWVPAAAAPAPPVASVWDQAREATPPASAWSSAVDGRPRAPTPNDIWGSMENSNVVDWARADFGQPPRPAADPLGLSPPPATDALPKAPPPVTPPAPVADTGWGPAATPAAPQDAAQGQTPAVPPAPAPAANAAADTAATARALAAAAGLPADQLQQPGPATLERAGQLLRHLVGGLVVMLEARARAKSQMGAERTGLEFDGNNPLKFSRTPDQALAQLLNPTERGFMAPDRAVEDAFFDLQSHQMATLKAMQGALRATLDRFSPAAIKQRAESGGVLQRLLPGGREATLWQTYEREFSGVAQGSDEAFMDVFAKEFRRAYDEQSRQRPKG